MGVAKKLLGLFLFICFSLICIAIFKAIKTPNLVKIVEIKTLPFTKQQIEQKLSHFSAWENWWPWKKNDSTMDWQINTINHLEVIQWRSPKNGAGTIEWISKENKNYKIRYEKTDQFLVGFFALEELTPSSTQISWTTQIEMGFKDKFFWVITNMEKAFQNDMTQGISALEQAVSASNQQN
jgi:hypothetical protein